MLKRLHDVMPQFRALQCKFKATLYDTPFVMWSCNVIMNFTYTAPFQNKVTKCLTWLEQENTRENKHFSTAMKKSGICNA